MLPFGHIFEFDENKICVDGCTGSHSSCTALSLNSHRMLGGFEHLHNVFCDKGCRSNFGQTSTDAAKKKGLKILCLNEVT